MGNDAKPAAEMELTAAAAHVRPPAEAGPATPRQTVGGVLRRLGPTGPLAIAALVLPLLGTATILSFLTDLAPWLQANATLGWWVYVGGFALLAGIAILPTHSSALLGGYAFGFALGLPAAMCGALGGALLGYAIARASSGDRVVQLINEHAKWRVVYDALLGSGFWKTLLIVGLLRLAPNSPFALTNLVLAATKVPLPTFLLATVLGMTPRIAIVVYMAAHFSQLDWNAKGSKWMVAGAVLLTLVILAILGRIAQQAVTRATRCVPAASSGR